MTIRKTLLWTGAAALAAGTASAQDLTFVSWGGAYQASQQKAYVEPYLADHPELSITWDESSAEAVAKLRAMEEAGNITWDLVDVTAASAIRACDEGLAMEVDHDELLAPAPDGTDASDDFGDLIVSDCFIPQIVYSTTLAYRNDVADWGGKEPEDVCALFDLENFPGQRTLEKRPLNNLEWALIADGVEPDSVYAELETRDGVDRAFRMLDRIKPVLSWWRTGSEAVQLLESGKVAMSSVYSGRVHATADAQTPLKIVWDHQVWYLDVWSIPMNGENIDTAREFIRFATSTRSLANQAGYIPYGPARRSSMALLAPEVRRRLPTAEENFRTAFESDDRWWSENIDRLNHEFRQWLKREVMVPERLRR